MINSAADRVGTRFVTCLARVALLAQPTSGGEFMAQKAREGKRAARVSRSGRKKEEQGGPDAQIRAPDPSGRPVDVQPVPGARSFQ